MRWKLQAAVRCLVDWRELTAEEMRKRNLMQRIVSRMLHRSLSFAMDLWQQSLSAARQERAEEERRQAVMSRIVKRMLNQAQTAAFERWTSNVIELARQRNIMDRILRRMLNAKMAGGQTAVLACLLGVSLTVLHQPWVFAFLPFLTCGTESSC